MPSSTHAFQAPKGTRDFYPEEMAIRRHLESVWRDVSINHGFDEVEGPTFEHLDLYTVKSGPGIVSELFSFRRSGGETDYALRPEFTPTLARMVAARAASLPTPVKWFSIPSHFRAERPQRGRLREFIQWNVDIVGSDSATADAEVIGVTIGALEKCGLSRSDITVKISHRQVLNEVLEAIGIAPSGASAALDLLDKRARMKPDAVAKRAAEIGLELDRFDARMAEVTRTISSDATVDGHALGELIHALRRGRLWEWCQLDFSIVRGMAYYTGSVFEVHALSGKELAIAGGGRYDNLIELFGGPPTPAVGIAMGDVVLRLVLEDRNLLQPAEAYLPRPDAFLIPAVGEAEPALHELAARLRREGRHVRHSYRTTRNVGKLLKEASRARARCAVILGVELAEGRVVLKDLDRGEEQTVPYDAVGQLVGGIATS